MRICFWSTTLQADNLALAVHLSQYEDCEVTVATDTPDVLHELPSWVGTFRGVVLARGSSETKRELSAQRFDVMVVDNHLPSFACADRLFVLWHGFGWRVDDLSTMRKQLTRLVGDVRTPNPRFAWQAFGDWDRQYRVEHSLLHPQNVHALGSPFSDLLLPNSPARRNFDRGAQQHAYTIDLGRPVVLLGMTWHHTGLLGHWGEEEVLLSKLVEHVESLGAAALLRMHDRQRYERHAIRLVERLAARFPRTLMLKWKDTSPDSLLDLLVSDVCVSNYSSLLNGYYYSERPSVHIDPHDASAARPQTFKMFMGLPMRRTLSSAEALWKLPPEENGGLRARSFDELLSQIELALRDPTCCVERSRAFVARYVTDASGDSAARSAKFLRAWLART